MGEIGMAKSYFFVDSAALISRPDLFETKTFAEKVSRVNLKTVDGREVVKVECKNSFILSAFRDLLEENGFETFEADIPFRRSLFKDYIKRVNYSLDRDVVFLDIECDDSKGGVKDYGKVPIIAVTLGFMIGEKELLHTFTKDDYVDEYSLLCDVFRMMIMMKRKIVVGWNVKYDVKNLRERAKKVFKLGTRFGNGMGYNDVLAFIDDLKRIDMREEYKRMVKGLSRYSLEEVVEYEGLGKKLHTDKKIHQMTPEELRERNRVDVELLMKLERRYHFVETKLRLANEVNLDIDMLSPYQIWDTLVLRRLRELGYVAPNGKRSDKVESYSGALVIEPVSGLHEDVYVLDVKSMYPSIVLKYKIDIANFNGEVLPYLMEYWVNKKMEYEKKGDKVGREVAKLITNSGYGQFGYSPFRFYDKEKAEMITQKGREVIMTASSLAKKDGWEVIYGDTDSLFVKKKDGDVRALAEKLNSTLGLEFKVERKFDKLLLLKKASGKEGAKKRYVGCEGDKLIARGIELRRGDFCKFSKRVLVEVIKKVFDGEKRSEIMQYLNDMKKRLFNGEFDDELVLRRSVKKEYKVRTFQGVAYTKALRMGLVNKNIDEIEFVMTKQSGVEPYVEGKKYDYDYKYYWEKQVWNVCERVLRSLGDNHVQKTLF